MIFWVLARSPALQSLRVLLHINTASANMRGRSVRPPLTKRITLQSPYYGLEIIEIDHSH